MVTYSESSLADIAIRVISRLGASIRADRSLTEAFGDHIAIGKFACERLGHPNGLLRNTVAVFVWKFWIGALSRQPFRFVAPTHVRAELEAALDAPVDERVQAILRAVAFGLRIDFARSSSASEWLYGKKP
jgi:hypothetical protein